MQEDVTLKRLIPLMLVGLWAADAGATEIFEKVGTVGAQFLKIGVGARAAAMGEAFTPIADDATALYWNPAGIARLEGNQITLNHASWPAEIGHEFVGTVFSYGSIPGTFGVSLNVLQMKPMNVTTPFKPNGTGDTFDAGDMAIGFTYARMLTNKFSFGGTLRWVHQGIEEEFAEGIMADFGTLYDTGFRGIMVGMAIQNLGPNLKFIEQDYSLPAIFKLGIAMPAFASEMHRLQSAFEFNHPTDTAERANMGLEYVYLGLPPNFELALRGGYMLNRDEESFAGGFGVKFPTSKVTTARVDYAFVEMGKLGESHKISLLIQL
jgi:hypothetical protein